MLPPDHPGQQHDQVGNLLRVGQSASRGVGDGLLGDLVEMAVRGLGDGGGHAVVPSHRSVSTRVARLDETGLAYLDYTGSALPAERQLRAHAELLSRGVFGNPHADSDPSRRSTAALEAARTLVLDHLRADAAEYTVCFTANATAAVKLVAESYPFAPNGACALSADNHNSLNGVREFARHAGAPVVYLPLDSELRLTGAADRLAELVR